MRAVFFGGPLDGEEIADFKYTTEFKVPESVNHIIGLPGDPLPSYEPIYRVHVYYLACSTPSGSLVFDVLR